MKNKKVFNQFKKKYIYHKIHPLVLITLLILCVEIIVNREGEIQWRKNVISPLGDPTFTTAMKPKNSPLTHEDIIKASNHPTELMAIWTLESNRGNNRNPQALHNYCKSLGKSNELGYGGMAKKWCYDSFEQAVRVVDEWLDQRISKTLCVYNEGVERSDCDYAKHSKLASSK